MGEVVVVVVLDILKFDDVGGMVLRLGLDLWDYREE